MHLIFRNIHLSTLKGIEYMGNLMFPLVTREKNNTVFITDDHS